MNQLVKFKGIPGSNKARNFARSRIMKEARNAGNYSSGGGLRQLLMTLRNYKDDEIPAKDDIVRAVQRRIDRITRNARYPSDAITRLSALKSNLGFSSLSRLTRGRMNSNIRRLFNNEASNLRRKAENEERRMHGGWNRVRRMQGGGNRVRHYNNFNPTSRVNNAPPRAPLGAPPVFTPPPNRAQPNLAGPPLNITEQKAIANVPGGETRALNLVQNAGGPNNVLRAANQLKEAGGSPNLAVAKGANAKNIKIVLQLGGANNASKVATAVPKLRRRRRAKKTKSRPRGSGKLRISALKKLIKRLPKKALLSALPANAKKEVAGKNKSNVATRVTSYLSGRTKHKK
jgi:hypothetical protein